MDRMVKPYEGADFKEMTTPPAAVKCECAVCHALRAIGINTGHESATAPAECKELRAKFDRLVQELEASRNGHNTTILQLNASHNTNELLSRALDARTTERDAALNKLDAAQKEIDALKSYCDRVQSERDAIKHDVSGPYGHSGEIPKHPAMRFDPRVCGGSNPKFHAPGSLYGKLPPPEYGELMELLRAALNERDSAEVERDEQKKLIEKQSTNAVELLNKLNAVRKEREKLKREIEAAHVTRDYRVGQYENEKKIRIKYQDVVYKICKMVDEFNGSKLGAGSVAVGDCPAEVAAIFEICKKLTDQAFDAARSIQELTLERDCARIGRDNMELRFKLLQKEMEK